MASFAESYFNHKSNLTALATMSFLNSGKYTVNPELRAKMIVDATQKTNMDFCKAFWNLTENYGLQVTLLSSHSCGHRECFSNTPH